MSKGNTCKACVFVHAELGTGEQRTPDKPAPEDKTKTGETKFIELIMNLNWNEP